MRAIAEQYVAGTINHAEFVIQSKAEIRAGGRGMAMLENGGELSKSDLGRIGAAVKQQYRFFDAFANAVENGDVPLGQGLIARAGLYGANQFSQFQAFVRVREKKAGITHERNILGFADHCAGCLAETGRGWVKIGSLVPIGSRDCLARCRCTYEYR